MHRTFHTQYYLKYILVVYRTPKSYLIKRTDNKWKKNETKDYSKFHIYPNGFHPHLFLSSVLERWQEVGGQNVLFFHSLIICISHVTDGQAQERTLIIPVVQLQ
jgi:hypothetical protein